MGTPQNPADFAAEQGEIPVVNFFRIHQGAKYAFESFATVYGWPLNDKMKTLEKKYRVPVKLMVTISMQLKQRRNWVRQQFREPAGCKLPCGSRLKLQPNVNEGLPMGR